MDISPRARTREERLETAGRIFERVMQLHGDDVLAAGLYGSMARGDDGPFSDMEMMVVLKRAGVDESAEWTAGDWKAEVNFRSRRVVLESASELEGEWAMVQGEYVNVLPLYDHTRFFSKLHKRVFAHSDDDMRDVMREVIIGDMYELVGKWRNQHATGVFDYLPAIAFKLAQFGAWVIGLANRRLYTTSGVMFAESLALPDRPQGYDALCEAVMRGELSDASQVIALCEACWAGVVAWAESKRIELVTDPLNLTEGD
jgi:kanamycin nucleotidyltransferase